MEGGVGLLVVAALFLLSFLCKALSTEPVTENFVIVLQSGIFCPS